MATIDEDRSLEQLSHLSLVVLSQLHSCDAAQSMCNQRRERMAKKLLRKSAIREMSSWIIYGFRALVKKLGFHCKWCEKCSLNSLQNWAIHHFTKIITQFPFIFHLSKRSTVNFSSHFASCHPSPLESAQLQKNIISHQTSFSDRAREILHKFIDFKSTRR